jgi:hypothetical protein
VSLMAFGPRARFQWRLALACRSSFVGTYKTQRLASISASV